MSSGLRGNDLKKVLKINALGLDNIGRRKNQVVSNFKFGGNNLVYRFLKYLYDDSKVYLDRKMELYLELKEKINSHPIQ